MFTWCLISVSKTVRIRAIMFLTSLRVGEDEERLGSRFLNDHDFSANTRRAMRNDLRKFARWFCRSQPRTFHREKSDACGTWRIFEITCAGRKVRQSPA